MLEIRIKSDKISEVDDFRRMFKDNLRDICAYSAFRMSKVYPMKNGQYKFFVDCARYDDIMTLEKMNENGLLASGITNNGKKRGRKPKVLKTL